jgi:hypothetical protein
MAEDVFIPDPGAAGDLSVMIDPAAAGLSGAQQVLWLKSDYIGPVGSWETGPEGERQRMPRGSRSGTA